MGEGARGGGKCEGDGGDVMMTYTHAANVKEDDLGPFVEG